MASNLDAWKLINAIARLSGLRTNPRNLRAFVHHNSIKKLRNFMLANLEFRRREVALKSLPVTLFVEPTNLCNLRCPLCPTGAGEYGRPRTNKMSVRDFERIIDEIGDYLYWVNLFNFGEPLLNKDVPLMIGYAHEKGVSTCISTNGMLVDDQMAEALVRSKLDCLTFSIDGLTPETYSKYRVGGNFDKVIENLKRVVEWKRKLDSSLPFIEWQFLVFKHNQHEVGKVERFARALGANGTYIRNASTSTDTENRDEALKLTLSGEERKKYPEAAIGWGKVCDFLWFTITVNNDGGVSPCCLAYNKDDDFGNFFNQDSSLREIWNNDDYIVARRIFRDGRLPLEKDIICNTCSIANGFLQSKIK